MVEADLLIFDLDGTLVDSLADITLSANHTLAQLGLEPLPPETIRGFIGDGIRVLLEKAIHARNPGSGPPVEKAMEIYMRHHEQHCLDHVQMYDGVMDVLTAFAEKKMAVVSNKAYVFTKKILDRLDIARYFQVILGGDSLPRRKPDPSVIQYVLDRTQTPPGRCLMIGDGPQDIECARQAGVKSMAVHSGFRPSAELGAADFHIDEIADMTKVVR